MRFQQAFNNKIIIARCLVQYRQIFSSFLIFCFYFTCRKAREKSCKTWEAWKIFPILHSAPCDNNYLNSSTTTIIRNVNKLNIFNNTTERTTGKSPTKLSQIENIINLYRKIYLNSQQKTNVEEVLKIIKNISKDCSTGFGKIVIS